MQLPQARLSDIIEQETGKELLIYDLRTNKAYNLNETSKIVFKSCDGKTSFDDLKIRHKYTDDIIYLTLSELKRNNLIEGEVSNYFPGLSRREVVRRVGLACAIALPVIVGIVAPTAANAQSGVSCTSGGGGGNGDACHCSLALSLFFCNVTRGADCKEGCICRITDRQTQCNSNGNCDGICA